MRRISSGCSEGRRTVWGVHCVRGPASHFDRFFQLSIVAKDTPCCCGGRWPWRGFPFEHAAGREISRVGDRVGAVGGPPGAAAQSAAGVHQTLNLVVPTDTCLSAGCAALLDVLGSFRSVGAAVF